MGSNLQLPITETANIQHRIIERPFNRRQRTRCMRRAQRVTEKTREKDKHEGVAVAMHLGEL